MGQEMSKCKTSIRRGQPNPVYKETFVFQVALFQLSDVTLILSVYNKRSMKRKEMIGWISLGLNSSGEEELNHWTEMKESKGQQVCRWHALLESWGGEQAFYNPRQHCCQWQRRRFDLVIVGRLILWRVTFNILPTRFKFCGKTWMKTGCISGRVCWGWWKTLSSLFSYRSSRALRTCFWVEVNFSKRAGHFLKNQSRQWFF